MVRQDLHVMPQPHRTSRGRHTPHWRRWRMHQARMVFHAENYTNFAELTFANCIRTSFRSGQPMWLRVVKLLPPATTAWNIYAHRWSLDRCGRGTLKINWSGTFCQQGCFEVCEVVRRFTSFGLVGVEFLRACIPCDASKLLCLIEVTVCNTFLFINIWLAKCVFVNLNFKYNLKVICFVWWLSDRVSSLCLCCHLKGKVSIYKQMTVKLYFFISHSLK